MAMLLQDRRHFIFIQWTPEFGFLVFHLRAEILLEFLEDVILPRRGQVGPNRPQVTIEKIHTVFLNNPLQR
jgi:hypothetical protein